MTRPTLCYAKRMAESRAIHVRPPPLARLMAVVSLAFAAWMAYAMVQGLRKADYGSFVAITFTILFGVLVAGGAVVYMTWLAAQLWWHFSAMTVRWASATAVALLCLFAISVVSRFANSPDVRLVHSVVALGLIVVGAFGYRWLARTIIERTRVEDPLNLLGQPMGHAGRVKIFCVILGWAVFLAASEVVRLTVIARDGFVWALVALSPVLLGWLTYRIVLWRMTLPTRAALPSGGFEVIRVSEAQKDIE